MLSNGSDDRIHDLQRTITTVAEHAETLDNKAVGVSSAALRSWATEVAALKAEVTRMRKALKDEHYCMRQESGKECDVCVMLEALNG